MSRKAGQNKMTRTFKIEAEVNTIAEAVAISNDIRKANGGFGIFQGYEGEQRFPESTRTKHGIGSVYVTTNGDVFMMIKGMQNEVYMSNLALGTSVSGGYKALKTVEISNSKVTGVHIIETTHKDVELTHAMRGFLGKHDKIISTLDYDLKVA